MRRAFLVSLTVLGCSSPEQDALVVCQRAVRGQLIAPSTAVFAWFGEAEIEKARYAYIIKSSVESQNAMAVPIRQEFLCRVEGSTVTEGPFMGLQVADRHDCALAKYMEEELMPTEAARIELRRENADNMPECRLYERAGLLRSLFPDRPDSGGVGR